MTSYVGLSSTARAKLEQQARKLKGTLIVTLHKASHLKNAALFGSGSESDPFVVLRVGSQVFESLTARKGGAHPKFEQQFVFTIGSKDEEASQGAAAATTVIPASPKASADDGALHVRIYDRSLQGGECIGRVDLNFVQLLQASANAAAVAHAQTAASSNGLRNGNDDVPSATNTRWHAVSAASDLRIQAGWICITATFKGTGLPSEGDASTAAEHTGQADAPAESKPKQKLADGEYKVDFNEAPPASAVEEAAATGSAASNGSSSDASALSSSSSSSPLARSSLLPPLFPISAMLDAPPAAPIVLTLPNPHLDGHGPLPLPPPADASSAYYKSPAEGWPTPRPDPPAPGYTAPEAESGPPPPPQQLGSPSSRATTAQGERPMSPPAVAASSSSADALPSESVDSLNLDLITAFDQRHPHILQLAARVPSGRFLCAACAGEGHASTFHCTQGCDWSLHESCLQERVVDSESSEEDEDAAESRVKFAATPNSPPRTAGGTRKPDMRRDPRHAHPLTWMSSVWSGTYLCGGCGGGGSGPAWHCTSCVWDLHPSCCR